MTNNCESGFGANLRRWLPAIIVVVAVISGYVQLASAVRANSFAIHKQAVALEKMTGLMITDAKHEVELIALRRDLEILWSECRTNRVGP